MSIITENVDVETKSFTANAWNSIKEFKDKYCPDGQTCENLLTVGLLVGMVVFMYIAMEPIM